MDKLSEFASKAMTNIMDIIISIVYRDFEVVIYKDTGYTGKHVIVKMDKYSECRGRFDIELDHYWYGSIAIYATNRFTGNQVKPICLTW